ncbi:cellulose synthase subunit BcsC-related outer membrane protein [Paraburkholderia denitrificans]|uniref:Cellulose synthase subunit BcsC-related outer membrane protein n=1 Tax=Paraburkholderia denitrificans TaxID=694025 RepID=A0ABW0JH03_9BURK
MRVTTQFARHRQRSLPLPTMHGGAARARRVPRARGQCRVGAFTCDLKGSIGVEHYWQGVVPYFPLDPGRQASAASNMNSVTTSSLDPDAIYPGQSRTGFAYSLYASDAYQLAPLVAVGAMASLGNAYHYREWLAAVYVRYSFTPPSGLQPFSPKTFTSPFLANLND